MNSGKLSKKILKEIKNTRGNSLSSEASRDQELLTAAELDKKFPKKYSRKKEELTAALKRKKEHHLKENLGTGLSKRTTPGLVGVQSAPASCHKEGSRWIKTLSKQTKNQRIIATHHGKR